MRSIVRKSVLDVTPYLPGKPIEEVKRELGLKDVIKLASNESPFSPSLKVLETITRAARDLNRYPDGGCYHLRQALSHRLGVAGNQIIFGNGSDEIIVMAVRAFVDKGDEVILARPSFLIYEIASKIAGAQMKAVPLKDFRYDLSGMKKTVTKKTKIIFIGNPDNPASTYITQKEVVDFLQEIRRDILVFFDEAYFEFVDEKDYPDTVKFLKTYKNIIVSRTFSKMYGLAGLRIGYGIANPELIDLLNRVREPFNVNSLAQAAALACLKDPKYYEDIKTKVNAQKRYLCEEFKNLGLKFVEGVTNFILVDVGRNSRGLSEALLKKGVIIRDMNFWGLKNFIRVTIGTQKENQKFIHVLKEVL